MERATCSYWAKGSSGHRLFISAFMLSSKIICDGTYSNKSWCIVGQGMFALWEIDQMERAMCSYWAKGSSGHLWRVLPGRESRLCEARDAFDNEPRRLWLSRPLSPVRCSEKFE